MTLAEVEAPGPAPIKRLVQSLKDLSKELQTSLTNEREAYRKKKNVHLANVQNINNNINAANKEIVNQKVKINEANRKIKDSTISIKNAIASKQKRIARMKKEADARDKAHRDYKQRVQDHNQAIGAADQCIELVSKLTQKSTTSLLEVKEATLSIRQLEVKIRATHATETPFIEAMIALVSSQNFADGAASRKVLSLLQEFRQRLVKSLAKEHLDEKQAKKTYQAGVEQGNSDLKNLDLNIKTATAVIESSKKIISECQGVITMKIDEVMKLKEKLETEEDAFRNETKLHKETVAEIKKEIQTVNSCIDKFSRIQFSSYLKKGIDRIVD